MHIKNSVFCPLPWTLLSSQPSGIVRVCPPAHSSKGRGILRSEKGDIYKLGSVPISEIRNSSLLNKLRTNMLSGVETPEICQRCITDEKSNLRSRRKLEQELNPFEEGEARRITNENGSINNLEMSISSIELRFGNKCNLTCRMCFPGASSSWYKEFYETRSKRFTDGDEKHELIANSSHQITLAKNIYNWYESDFFWNDLRQYTQHVHEYHFSGGEPFLIKEHYDFLESLVEMGLASTIALDYNSNITFLPERLLKIWKSFKKVSIGASIDGVGEVNNYIRYPSVFSTIERNLSILDNTESNIEVWVATTVSALNILNLVDLYKWLLESQFKKVNKITQNVSNQFFISSHMLHSPDYLSIKILPLSLKKNVEIKFNEFLSWHFENKSRFSSSPISNDIRHELLKNHLKGIVDFMYSDDVSDLLPAFYKEVMLSDHYRKQSFQSLFPDFYEELKKIRGIVI